MQIVPFIQGWILSILRLIHAKTFPSLALLLRELLE